jgi:hypothetical protein
LADPRALVLAFRHGRWDVATADTRTEWSYAAALDRVLGGPRRPAPAAAGGPRPGGRWGPLTLPVAALIVMVAAVMAGAGTWYAVHQAPTARIAVARHSVPPSPVPSSPSLRDGWVSSSLALSAAPPQPSSTPPTAAADAAVLAPAAARYPGAAAIQAVINRYFQAINGRDYAAYQATQSPGNAMTESQFQAGFGSTRDSDVLITGITIGPGGQPAADVTFTSQQQPQDGPEGESCTKWHVMMFLDSKAGTYTIGAPPNGYKASYQACSS